MPAPSQSRLLHVGQSLSRTGGRTWALQSPSRNISSIAAYLYWPRLKQPTVTMTIIPSENSFELASGVQLSARTNACWQVVCNPGDCSAEVGLARQRTFAHELTSQSATPTLMIWRCQPALLVTRSETRLPHFASAAAEMQTAGWPVLLRQSGGGVCAVGSETVQVSIIETAFSYATMNAKYRALSRLIQDTLCFFQIASRTGPVIGAYCPGSYDIAVQGKKIAGMSQHWFRNCCGIRCVVTAASINIDEPPDVLAAATNRFYSSAGSPLRCQANLLTNMRLCGAAANLGGMDLAAAYMNQLSSKANMCSAAAHVFDTAPTANARRLLGMSSAYSLWVNKMLKSREEARTSPEVTFLYEEETNRPTLMDYLVSFRDRMEHARNSSQTPRSRLFSS